MTIISTEPTVAALWATLDNKVAHGERFAGLSAARTGDAVTLTAYVAGSGQVSPLEATLPPGTARYPSLTPRIRAAFWYERAIHDLTGIVPEGHPRLAPLLKPGNPGVHVAGYGMFTIPHGPVRSGVFESMEYLVETPGEAIPHLNMRIFYKHRGMADRFAGASVADGVLLAERAEGIASVAHALAYCHAIEAAAGCEIPRDAAFVRVIHAELERIANHLDVAMRLADAAGLAVATARFALHKERVLRMVSGLGGNRFGRGVVIPGGVAALPRERPVLDPLERDVLADARALMGTSSFLDRLRGTGPLTRDRAAEHGALGPIGKASEFSTGDALARLQVRWEEIAQAFRLIRQASEELSEQHSPLAHVPCDPARGRAVGWAEAPQGEVLYDVTIEGGRIARCQPRSASFHNLVLMHEVFAGDILTDFPFIEASFGLSVAGAVL